jgi:DNA-binding NtrC family response regulator
MLPDPTIRVLIADGDKSVRDFIVSELAYVSCVYQCEGVDSGENALARLEQGPDFHVVISQIVLQGMDGFQLLRRIREKYPDTRVIIATSVHDVSAATHAIRAGASDYLLKPLITRDLLEAVRSAVASRKLAIETRDYQHQLESLVASLQEQVRTLKLQATQVNGKPN